MMKLNEQQQAELRQRMADVAALPPSDPQRLDVVREVVAAGPWAQREWVELIAGDERIRMDLQRVDVPSTLSGRLMQIPDESHSGSGDDAAIHAGAAGAPSVIGRITRSPWLRVAAVVVLAVAVWATIRPGGATDEVRQRLGTLGVLAVDHHLINHPMHILTTSTEELNDRIAGRLHYRTEIPELGDGYALEGAAICKLGGHPVVCTRWKHDGRNYTLYQYCTRDFRLPKQIDRQTVSLDPWHSTTERAPREVEFWTRGDCAYALVADPDSR